MEKRIFIAVLVSIALLWGWALLAPKMFPDLVKPNKPAPVQTAPEKKSPTTNSAAPSPQRHAEPALPASVKSGPIPTTAIAATRVEYTTIERPGFVARFSNRGAQLVSFQLTGYKTKDGKSNVELVKSRDMSRTDFPFSIEARNGALASRLNS